MAERTGQELLAEMRGLLTVTPTEHVVRADRLWTDLAGCVLLTAGEAETMRAALRWAHGDYSASVRDVAEALALLSGDDKETA